MIIFFCLQQESGAKEPKNQHIGHFRTHFEIKKNSDEIPKQYLNYMKIGRHISVNEPIWKSLSQ